MSDAADLYETDFSRWAEEQAHALRDAASTGANLPLDWLNLAEEVESLARSDRRELRSRIETVLEHLLKLAYSPAIEPRNGWRHTVRRERHEIDLLLEDNRTLRADVGRLIETYTTGVASRVADELQERGEIAAATGMTLRTATFQEAQVLGDWFPPDQA